MSRSRSLRLATLTLMATAPLTGALASPAHAASGTAVVGAVVTDGNVHVESTKGLSRVTVVLCDGVPVVRDNWGGDQESGDVEIDGIVRAVFVHSGDNTTAEAKALLAALAGAAAVKGDSTGAIAFHDADACDEPAVTTTTTTTSDSTTTTTTESSTTTTTGAGSTTTTAPGGTTSTTTDSTGSSSTTTTLGESVGGVTTTTAPIQTIVLGETLTKAEGPAPAGGPASAGGVSPGALARTGAGYAMFLATLGLGLLALGVALVSVFRRRRALSSASSPG